MSASPPAATRSADDSDEALMAAYVAGQTAAFDQLFQRYSGRLYGYFLRSVGAPALAHDMTQQTFLHLHRARRDFQRGRKLRPWLFTIALNVRREHFRRRQRKPEVQWDKESHGEPSTGPDVLTARERLVRQALGQLKEDYREILVLHWYEGFSFREIGEMMGISNTAAKLRAHRAYKQLRVLLAEEEAS